MQKCYAKSAVIVLVNIVFLAFCAVSLAATPPVDFRSLVKAAGPAVVNINTERSEQVRSLPPGMDLFRGMPDMDRFLDEFEQFQGGPRTRKSSSLGSGFIISSDGYIVTNNHVVEGASTIRVSMGHTGKENSYPATVVGTDPVTDLALIKIEAKDLPVLTFGDSDAVEVGEWVLAIGSPLGLDHTVTAGIISAKSRSIQSGPYDDFLQTDASINQGNSGGPLLNMDGQVIGINTAIAARAQGIGFAVPSTMAQKVITALKEHRKVSRGWLGVTIQSVDETTAKALGLPAPGGALVGSVIDGDPAEKAGIRSGDVILSIGGKDIPDTEQLLRTVADIQPNTKTDVVIWRDGKKLTVTLVVAERDGEKVAAGSEDKEQNSASGKLGMKVRPVGKDEARRLNLQEIAGVVVVGVGGDSLAAKAGIEPGDVVLAVNGTPVNTEPEFTRQVDTGIKERGAVLLQVSRRGQLFFKAIDVKE